MGYREGLSSEICKLLGLLGGIFISYRYYDDLGMILSRNTGLAQDWALGLMMIFVLFVGYLLFTLAIKGMGRVGKVAFEGSLEQNGGLLVGLVRGGLLASVILVTLIQLPSSYLRSSIQERSLIGRPIAQMAPAVYDTTNTVPVWVAEKISAD